MNSSSPSEKGWYRIAHIDAQEQIVYGLNGIICIRTAFVNESNMSATLLINGVYKTAVFTELCSTGSKIINSVRCVSKDDKLYIDVYYMSSTQNTIYVEVYGRSREGILLADKFIHVEDSDYDTLLGTIDL